MPDKRYMLYCFHTCGLLVHTLRLSLNLYSFKAIGKFGSSSRQLKGKFSCMKFSSMYDASFSFVWISMMVLIIQVKESKLV